MIFVKDVDGNLVNLGDKDLRIWSGSGQLVAININSDYFYTLAHGSEEYCRDALESLERWLERHATIIHPTFGVEPAAEPDEPEGSFAQDDYIDDLPL